MKHCPPFPVSRNEASRGERRCPSGSTLSQHFRCLFKLLLVSARTLTLTLKCVSSLAVGLSGCFSRSFMAEPLWILCLQHHKYTTTPRRHVPSQTAAQYKAHTHAVPAGLRNNFKKCQKGIIQKMSETATPKAKQPP